MPVDLHTSHHVICNFIKQKTLDSPIKTIKGFLSFIIIFISYIFNSAGLHTDYAAGRLDNLLIIYFIKYNL